MTEFSNVSDTWEDIRFALTKRSQPAFFWLSSDDPSVQAAIWLNLRREFRTSRSWDMDLSDKNVVSLGAELKKYLPRSFFEQPEPDTLVHIFGLERSIGNFGQTEFITELNFERDAIFREFPFNILIWTDTVAQRQVQRYGKDFWHWVNYDFELSYVSEKISLPVFGVLFHEEDKEATILTNTLRKFEREGQLQVGFIRSVKEHKQDISKDLHLDNISVLFVWLTSSMLNTIQAEQIREIIDLQGNLIVIPVIAEPCDWKASFWARFSALPDNSQALSDITPSAKRINDALVRGVEALLSDLSSGWWGERGKHGADQIKSLLEHGNSFLTKRLINWIGFRLPVEILEGFRNEVEIISEISQKFIYYFEKSKRRLFLGGTQIGVKLPEYLIERLNYLALELESLDLTFTSIRDLSPLANIVNLKELSCSSTQVSDLSPLVNLKNLRQLDCSGSNISDLSPLISLRNLQHLDCSRTNVNELTPLTNLHNLKHLAFHATKVNNLLPLSGLANLKEIGCSNTPISDLSPISNLINLQKLICHTIQINDLSALVNLKNLKHICFASTRIYSLSYLANLKNLEHLDCGDTQINDLSALKNMSKLQRFWCERTKVSDISPLLPLIEKGIPVKWQNWYEDLGKEMVKERQNLSICVKDCPIVIPPIEFVQESPQAVRDYFEELGDDGRKLNEVKVIFIGEAAVGKTSIIMRLFGEDFDSKGTQTHGIRIRKALFAMDDGDSVTAHLWDFGGQEVMHATHQFFLSQRSVYVLLLNSRNDDQAEKWLKHAASFGGRSPVLVVLNKIDENPSFEVNRKTLQEKYPQIRDFFRLSAKTDKGLDEFRESLRREIDRADTRRTPFPKHWLAVKEHFSNMEADYIESAEYRRVCEANSVTRQFSQDVLLQFLHDLGVVINFRNLKNFDTQVLNPLWLNNGVYRIINSDIIANAGGLLHEDDFDTVINDPHYGQSNTSNRLFQYSKDKSQYIVRVMQEFELCFQLDARSYVVPQLLPVQEPEFRAEGALLRFVIHFPDFLPDSIFPRLMVKLHTFIERNPSDRVTQSHPVTTPRLTMWRTGMVLHKPNIFNALARVRWDKEDQKILVDVCGEERRRFLSFIRETVKEIVEDFTNLNVEEMVPIPETEEFFEYQYLVEAEKAGEKELFVKQLKKRIPLADLLDGVEEPAMRDEVEQLPVRAFVSYSHKDLEYLKELRTALAPLMRLQKLQLWDDRDIDAGDEWVKVIFQQLEEADIVLCLVSADFVASDFCYKKEFGAALEAHRKGEKTIVPVMLRKTDWQDLPLAEIQGTPGEWITSAKNKDEAWTKVSESLRPALDKAKQRKKVLLEKRRGM